MNGSKKLRLSESVVQIIWLFALVVLVASVFSVGIYASSQLAHLRYRSDMHALYRVAGLKNMLYQCDDSMKSYLHSGNRAKLVTYNEGVKTFMQNVEELKAADFQMQKSSLLYSIDDSFESYQASSNYAAHFFYENQNINAYSALYDAQRISAYLKNYCDSLLETYIQMGHTHYGEIEHAQNVVLIAEIVVLLLLLLCAGLSIRLLRRQFGNPLSRLYEASLEITGGNFDVHVSEKEGDSTMRSLSAAFNTMTESIRHMVDDLNWAQRVKTDLLNEKLKNTEYQRLLEQANFMALQAQVNPHFLFNTLNSVSRTVTLERNDDAVAMIDALAGLLRYNLADASVPATLGSELDIAQRYVLIQQFRFAERVQAVYDYDLSEIGKVLIPRFTLQPIIENAVIHGLEPKLTPGLLRISIHREEEICVISIIDDGVGMSEEKLEQVTQGTGLGRVGHTSSIGVNNTRKRLEVFTHDKTCFSMTSEIGKGTCVHLRVPFQTESNNEGG